MGDYVESYIERGRHTYTGGYVHQLGSFSTTPTRTLNSAAEWITPARARDMRDSYHFERQRPISQKNVERLAKEMVAGRFTKGTQIYLAVLPDKTAVILNGNHTLEAVYESGTPQWLTITKVPVKDLDEAGRIYAVFDTQKARSMRDALKGLGRSDDIPMASSVLAAVGVISTGFTDNSRLFIPRLDRLDMVEDYRDEAEMFADAISGARSENIGIARRSGLLAVALYTLKHQPSMAFEFWRSFALDDGLSNGDPAKALLSWCRRNIATGKVARIAHCHAAALAWNAAFRGEKRDHIKPGKMKQIHILGTPFAEA